jgi:hypothetical protein
MYSIIQFLVSFARKEKKFHVQLLKKDTVKCVVLHYYTMIKVTMVPIYNFFV